MKNKVKMLIIFVLIGGLSISNLAYAQTPVDLTEEELEIIEKRREKREAMKVKMQEELGLTEEQQQSLEEHRNTHRSQIKEQKEAMKNLHEQLRMEIGKIEINMAKIYSIHEQIKTLNNKEADHRLEGILQLRKILTPKQFQKFDEKFRERRKSGLDHVGMHRGEKGEPFKGAHPEFDPKFE